MIRCLPGPRVLLLLPLLTLLPGCGGGGSSAPVSAPVSVPASSPVLHYVNPAAASGHFQLVVDPASNDTAHLLLDLTGPPGTLAQGVALFITAGSGAVWGSPGGTDSNVSNGSVFTLGSPALFKSKVAAGDLQAGLFQTGAPAATLGAGPILTLALDLAGTAIPKGTAVTLAATSGKNSAYLDGNLVQQPLTLDVGTLATQ